LIIPIIGFFTCKFKFKKYEQVAVFLIFSIFFGQLFFTSYKKSSRYAAALPNRGGAAIARWLNDQEGIKKVLVYSSRPMVRYYLRKKVILSNMKFNIKAVKGKRKFLMRGLLRKLENRNIDRIISDFYLPIKSRPWEAELKKILREEGRKGVFIEVEDEIGFEGIYAAIVYKVVKNDRQNGPRK